MNHFQIFSVFCGNGRDLSNIVSAKMYFPYPFVTARIRLDIVEADFQIAIKLNLLGTTPSYVFRNDPNNVIVDGEAGNKLTYPSICKTEVLIISLITL